MVAFLAELRPELTPSLLFLLALLPAMVGKLNKAQHGKTGDDSGESDGAAVAWGCSALVMACVGTPLALFYALCPRFFEVFQVMSQRPVMIAVGAALTVGGITLTCWARWVLGGNWVGGPYLRQQHQLVARGPYRQVRQMNSNLRARRRVRTAYDDDGSAVILNMWTGRYFFLNKTAGLVWRLLIEEKCTVEQALPKVAAHFGISVERLSDDLGPVIAKLLQARLLTERS